MKKTFFFMVFAIFGIIANANAQLTMSFGTTNAQTVSQSGLTYNVSIPFFESDFTGSFKITRPIFSCTAPGIKTMSVNNLNTGAFIANNGNTNTNYVNLPGTYTFPVGTTILKVSSNCYSPSSPSTPVVYNITVIVTKLPDPALNITLTPYCQIDNHTGNYTNYFGYHVSGSATNRNGLRFKVVADNGACSTQAYWNLNTSFTYTSNIFTPGSSFYSCNSATWYNVYLEYVYTPYGASTQSIVPIATNTYGWQNHRWRKTIFICMPILEEENDPKLGKSAQSQISVFPNPTDGIVSFNIDNDTEIKSIVVYDMSNVKLLSFDKLKSKEIDLSSLKNGIYFIHIETNSGIFKKQIIKN
jgi:hypothetical protein